MQELAFIGLMAALGLMVATLLYAVCAAFGSKTEDEFNASYHASAEGYRKRYKEEWVTEEEHEEKASWLRDYEEGEGFDKRFWDPKT